MVQRYFCVIIVSTSTQILYILYMDVEHGLQTTREMTGTTFREKSKIWLQYGSRSIFISANNHGKLIGWAFYDIRHQWVVVRVIIAENVWFNLVMCMIFSWEILARWTTNTTKTLLPSKQYVRLYGRKCERHMEDSGVVPRVHVCQEVVCDTVDI